MREACTLKVREYLANGLPVYAGHVDSGLPINFPYFFTGPPRIPEILEYARRVRNVDRVSVSSEAKSFIDKEALLLKLYNALNEHYAPLSARL
jgi:hypothetical protein